MTEKRPDSEYTIQKAILEKIGGDASKNFDSPYSVQLAILDAIEGGGAVIDDENISPNTVWSSEKVYDELGGTIIQDGQIMTQELYDFLHHRPFPHNEHRIILKKGDLCCEGTWHNRNQHLYGLFFNNGWKVWYLEIFTISVGDTITIQEVGNAIIDDDNISAVKAYSSQKVEAIIGDIDTILQTIIGA